MLAWWDAELFLHFRSLRPALGYILASPCILIWSLDQQKLLTHIHTEGEVDFVPCSRVCVLVVYFANWPETPWVSAVKSVCLSFRGLFLFYILQLLAELFGFNQGDIVEDKSTFLPPVGRLHSHVWYKSCHGTKLYKPQLGLSCRSYLEIQYWFVSSLVLLSKFQNNTLLNVHN